MPRLFCGRPSRRRQEPEPQPAFRRGDPTTDDLLNHPDVVGTLRAVLIRRGIKDQELIDGIAEVQARAWAETATDRPNTVVRWQAVCRPIATPTASTSFARNTRAPRTTRAPSGTPTSTGCPYPRASGPIRSTSSERCPCSQQQHDDGDMPPRGAEILDALSAGIPQSEQAAELGIKKQTMRNQVHAMRRTYRRRLVAAGLGALLAAPILVAVLRTHWRDDQARNHPTPQAPTAQPSQLLVQVPSQAPQHPTQEEVATATQLRQEAHDALKKHDWATCVYRLDDANRLDPAGASPDTSAEHDKCAMERALELEAKPRSR